MDEVRAAEAESFDRRYRADPDPWRYDSSPYERAKYEHTLAALPARPIGTALELGCSNGAFTERLAERCGRVLAVDFSPEAVRLARERTAELANVVIERRDLRAGLPAGSFDLIVSSEVLYYWEPEHVLSFCDGALGALAPTGSLVVVDWRGVDPEAPLDAAGVRELLTRRFDGRLAHSLSHDRPGYLLDRWDRDASVQAA